MSAPSCITYARLKQYERDNQPELFDGEIGLLKAQFLLDTRRMLHRHLELCDLCRETRKKGAA